MPVLYIRGEDGKFVPIPALQGESAYDQAKKGGYGGTEEEFIAFLNGVLNPVNVIGDELDNISTTTTGGGIMGKDATASSGGAIGYGANTYGGGAVGETATSTSGGAVGYKANTQSGGAVGRDATTVLGGAIGHGATSTYGASAGADAKAEYGGSVGYKATTSSGGAVGNETVSSGGGAMGHKASTGHGGAIGQEAKSTYGGAHGYKTNTTTGGVVGANATSTTGGAVGSNAKATTGGAVGENTEATLGGAVGYNAKETASGGALGCNANVGSGGAVGYAASGLSGGAVGNGARVASGAAVGLNARASSGVALGERAQTVAEGDVVVDAIQLGTGTNPNPRTLQAYDYPLMDANGKIPFERLPISHGLRVAYGSYVGGGNTGKNYPTKLTFDFKPLFIRVSDREHPSRYIVAMFPENKRKVETGYDDIYNWFSWTNNSVEWYEDSTAGRPPAQFNAINATYDYFVIGVVV